MSRYFVTAAVGLLALTAACGGGDTKAGPITLNYVMWADNQVPAYKQCADAFTKKNPTISIKMSSVAWEQYWQNLTTQVVSGTAPDVFRDSVAYYPQFAKNNQLLDISELATRDKVDLGQYQKGLVDIWVRDGKRYGLPLDWDTIGVFYNKDQVKKAGLDPAGFANWTWNPQDGGTFEKAIAALTVDDKGRKGTDPGFDKEHVAVYGFAPDYSAPALGQTSWAGFAVSNGFKYLDKNPFGSKYFYDDPKLAETVSWFAGLSKKGYAPPYDKQSALGGDALLQSGKAAMVVSGSWMAKAYLDSKTLPLAAAPLPAGPQGRKTPINGVSDAIYAGTKHKEEAWQWVKFVGSAECQDLVAATTEVLPAITTSSDKALAAHEAAGRDVTAFVDEAKAADGTFLLPVTDNADKINELMNTAISSVLLGTTDAKSALSTANTGVNALFQ
ncbi:sugar ABC transporter substrate-binding protein [Nonomuraea sp. NEAU-A123]|uniref:ABC transporter substrate-binding protein n=1 Tax=Nonomuraea sp. NEAU-A123 TaxID=2839649 RepID=UPI001BE44713|nr:sugar ABC transporter substrate-binding protein [Nonomuraea sp. NEAU-A123]MBT2234520.1 sugar ABC transporter substrate-binding protein [Nonomuraea sp. NEAU-A123]